MLVLLKRTCLFGLVLFCTTVTQSEEKKQPANNGWSARPWGKYKFLRVPFENKKETEIQRTLPFRRIKLERRAPGGYTLGLDGKSKGFPAVIYYMEFHVTGEAVLHAISGLEKNGIYKGNISLTDYARLCLLYETLIAETGDPAKFGLEMNSSHPVISELTLTFTENKDPRKHRNDANFGDFKFWVFENVLENIESKVKWKKVEE